jgi:hypothetical protein
MPQPLNRHRHQSHLAAAFLLTAAAGLGIGSADPSPAIERGFTAALAAPAASINTTPNPVAGSEAYWLGQDFGGPAPEARIQPVVWSPPVSRGEKIVVGAGAEARTLEVTKVELIEALTTRIDISGPRLLVTGRDITAGDGRIVEIEISENPGKAPSRPRSL